MIADLPLSGITQADLENLVDEGIREGRRLDYKLALDLEPRDARIDLLGDIVAFANADGGLLLYGVREGSGDDRGVAVEIVGVQGSPDQIATKIDSLVREGIDERLTGVQQRSIPIGDSSRFVHAVHIPASPLAPHMISVRTGAPRFLLRTNSSNEPMSARQIKDAALRHGAAIERAVDKIRSRVAVLTARARERRSFDGSPVLLNQATLHLTPLFPSTPAWGYDDPRVAARLKEVRPFGYHGTYDALKYTQHGVFLELLHTRHTGFLRDGTIEFQMYDVLEASSGNRLYFPVAYLEGAIVDAFADAKKLSDDGLLPLPALVQLNMMDIGGAVLLAGNRRIFEDTRQSTEADFATDALVLNAWDEADNVMKTLIDHIWQAWGYPASRHYRDGALVRFGRGGSEV